MSDLRAAGGPSTGEILDHRYVLRELIGEGGMARVYRADDEALGRPVAIKVLRDVEVIGSLDRARSETALLASLNHHGLVTLFDARISEDDLSYLVMEYVDGITLRDRIAQGPIPPAQAASIAVDLAEALHVAHSAGIVHRDIKPSNVLLWKSPLPGREWRAKLADFGIAHLLDSARVTTPGMIIGTVAYVAPEQARGDAPAPPADIYALGLLLMEALTGERPFADAEGIGAVMARLAAPPEVPGSLEPEWRGLLRGMTAMRPEDRPSALEVAITAERLALGTAPLPASLAEEPTQESAVADTGPTRLLPAAAAAAVAAHPGPSDDGVTVAIPPPPPPPAAGPGAGAAPESAPATSDDRQRRRNRLVAIIVAIVLAIGAATAALWWSTQAGAGDEPQPGPTPSVVDTPAPQPSDTPAETPAPSEDGGGEDDDSGSDNSGNGNGNGNGGGNDNSGRGNNSGNGGGNGGGNGNGP